MTLFSLLWNIRLARTYLVKNGLSRYRNCFENIFEMIFVSKVPKTQLSVAMDERELVMYNKIFPALQVFLSERLYEDQAGRFT